jgi:hypothetical protein
LRSKEPSCSFPCDAAKKGIVKAEKEAHMFEPAGRVYALPALTIHFLGTPEGGSGAGVAFLGYFFGEAKK